jgi:hypothetical protein
MLDWFLLQILDDTDVGNVDRGTASQYRDGVELPADVSTFCISVEDSIAESLTLLCTRVVYSRIRGFHDVCHRQSPRIDNGRPRMTEDDAPRQDRKGKYSLRPFVMYFGFPVRSPRKICGPRLRKLLDKAQCRMRVRKSPLACADEVGLP